MTDFTYCDHCAEFGEFPEATHDDVKLTDGSIVDLCDKCYAECEREGSIKNG